MPPKHACDTCYRRKIQCSIPNPDSPCNWCSHHATKCTFDREKPRRKNRQNRVMLARIQELLQRIRQLEDAQAALPTPSTECPAVSDEVDGIGIRQHSATTTDGPSSSSPDFAPSPGFADGLPVDVFPLRNHLGPNWFFNGMPIFSEQGRQWMSAKTGQAVDWAQFRILHTHPSLAPDPHFSPSELCALPDQDAVQSTLSVFFRSSFRLCFPILDRVLFEETLQTAYEPVDSPLSSPSHVSARACVLSALSVVCRWQGTEHVSRSIDANVCAAKAHCLLLRIAADVRVVTLQTALLLYVQRTLTGRWQDAALLLSMASRMVSALGGHIHRPVDLSQPNLSRTARIAQHTRILFWICYMADKDVSLQTGHAPLLTDAYCDLTLPENYASCYAYLRGLDECDAAGETHHEQLMPHFMGDPRLSHLKEKVYRMLYSARALENIDGLLLDIRQLDAEMERWRLSIPVDFRPVLVLPTTAPLIRPGMKTPQSLRYVHLQLEYHHLMAVIHTTVRRHSSETPGIGDETQNFHTVIHSSVDLALEAGRSTLWCVRELISQLAEQAFQFIVFYPTTAAMSLFLDMVIHPHSESIGLDLERLVSAANAIRSFPVPDRTRMEAQQVRDTSDFIMGLVWLGTCAVAKAAREEQDDTAKGVSPVQ